MPGNHAVRKLPILQCFYKGFCLHKLRGYGLNEYLQMSCVGKLYASGFLVSVLWLRWHTLTKSNIEEKGAYFSLLIPGHGLSWRSQDRNLKQLATLHPQSSAKKGGGRKEKRRKKEGREEGGRMCVCSLICLRMIISVSSFLHSSVLLPKE